MVTFHCQQNNTLGHQNRAAVDRKAPKLVDDECISWPKCTAIRKQYARLIG